MESFPEPKEKKLVIVSISQGFEIVKGLNSGPAAYLGGLTAPVDGEINGKQLLSNFQTRPVSRKEVVKTSTYDFPQPRKKKLKQKKSLRKMDWGRCFR